MDRLCVAMVNEAIAKVTVTTVKGDESLEDAALRTLVEDWKWLREDIQRHGDSVEHFLIDPDAWSWLKRIRWPTVRRNADEPAVLFQRNRYLVNLCKIRIYRAARMHWTHGRAMRGNRNSIPGEPCRTGTHWY